MTTEKTTKAAPAVNEKVIEMAKLIEMGLTMDNSTGVCTAGDDLFEKTLPEDLSIDTVRQVSKHNSTFVAAATQAFGNLSIAAMAGNKKLEETTVTIPMVAKDTLSVSMKRSKTWTNHLTPGAEPVVKFGVVSQDYAVTGGKNSGQLKAVKQALYEAAAEQLGKK